MGRRPEYDVPEELTAREREVLELLRLGLSDAQIAERLGITTAGAHGGSWLSLTAPSRRC